jgi:hypothetical protein
LTAISWAPSQAVYRPGPIERRQSPVDRRGGKTSRRHPTAVQLDVGARRSQPLPVHLAGYRERGDALAKEAVALEANNPSQAVRLWARIDHKLVDRSFVVPLSNAETHIFVSDRVGNYQSSQFNGPVLSQMWVK